MSNQNSTPKIYSALIGVMRDVGSIAKTSRNTAQGFNFRSIDAVYNALQPALIKNGVIIIPEVQSVDYSERQTSRGGVATFVRGIVKYTFIASEDGSSVSAIVAAEALDQSDKATNKMMSIAFKYACFQVLAIPTEDTAVDPDRDYVEIKPVQNQNLDSNKTSSTDNITFSSPQEAVVWASNLLGISEESAASIFSSLPADDRGKKGAVFRAHILDLVKKKQLNSTTITGNKS